MIILIVSVVGVIRWVFIRWCTTLRWRDIALLRFTPVKWWTMDWNAKDGCTGMSIVFTNRLQTLIFLSTKKVNSSAPRIFGLQMNQLTRWLDVTRQWLGHVFLKSIEITYYMIMILYVFYFQEIYWDYILYDYDTICVFFRKSIEIAYYMILYFLFSQSIDYILLIDYMMLHVFFSWNLLRLHTTVYDTICCFSFKSIKIT